ncbi:hypothetical protein HDU97_006334 [Phlyctochytrium planicorne]|nr:hypothetical protein HDU97_006334 [Phlyctochytrium planicorne]
MDRASKNAEINGKTRICILKIGNAKEHLNSFSNQIKAHVTAIPRPSGYHINKFSEHLERAIRQPQVTTVKGAYVADIRRHHTDPVNKSNQRSIDPTHIQLEKMDYQDEVSAAEGWQDVESNIIAMISQHLDATLQAEFLRDANATAFQRWTKLLTFIGYNKQSRESELTAQLTSFKQGPTETILATADRMYQLVALFRENLTPCGDDKAALHFCLGLTRTTRSTHLSNWKKHPGIDSFEKLFAAIKADKEEEKLSRLQRRDEEPQAQAFSAKSTPGQSNFNSANPAHASIASNPTANTGKGMAPAPNVSSATITVTRNPDAPPKSKLAVDSSTSPNSRRDPHPSGISPHGNRRHRRCHPRHCLHRRQSQGILCHDE